MIEKPRTLDNMFELAIKKMKVNSKVRCPAALCCWGNSGGLHNCHGFFCCAGENKKDKYSLRGTMSVGT